MNSVIIDPNLLASSPQLPQDIEDAARAVRLDVSVLTGSSLNESIEQAYRKHSTTVIAYGGFDWLDRVISEMCRSFVLHGNTPPIFGHIQPTMLPGFIARRLPSSHTKRFLQNAFQQIAARKIIEKPAFSCAREIWFTHSLTLEMQNESPNSTTKVLIRTPNHSSFSIQAPLQSLSVAALDEQLDQASGVNMTITGMTSGASTTKSNALLSQSELEALKHTPSKSSEKAFQVLAQKASIHAPGQMYSAHFDRTLPGHSVIEPAEFAIQVITQKNTVGKY